MRGRCKVYTIENHEFCGSTIKETGAIQEVKASRLNEFKHLDRGWSFVILFASFGTCCLIGANNYGTGIIHKILLERYNESLVLTSWSGSLQLSLMCLSAPLSSAIVDRFSCRTAVLMSGILFISGYWATAFAPNMHVAIFTCGISAGIAAGLGYTASIVAIGFNFKRRKHIALGLTLSGMGAGIFVFAPVMNMAHEYYGSVGFFITMATISANIITFGTLLFPSELEIHTHKQRDNTIKDEDKTAFNTLKMYYRAVIKKPVLLLAFATFAFCGGTDVIFLNLPTIVTYNGFTSKQAAFLVSLNGIMSVVGRFLTGFLSHFKQISEIWLYCICLGIVSITTFIYPFVADIFEGQIAYCFMLGLFFGTGYVLISPISSKFIDIHFISAAVGFVLCFGGLGSLILPVLAGIFLDRGGTYSQCLLSAGGAVLVAVILGAVTKCFRGKNTQQLKNTVDHTAFSYTPSQR